MICRVAVDCLSRDCPGTLVEVCPASKQSRKAVPQTVHVIDMAAPSIFCPTQL
jgi:hypothetical protein